jgi:hypothetical protein
MLPASWGQRFQPKALLSKQSSCPDSSRDLWGGGESPGDGQSDRRTTVSKVTLELVPLCTLDVTLADPVIVGDGPAGLRLIYEVLEMTVEGERLQGKMLGRAGADWVTVSGTVGTLDVRFTMETHDDAIVLVQYQGRTDLSGGPGNSPIYVAPRFETSDPRYLWLNTVQAVGKGVFDGSQLRYEWCEVR